MTDIIGVDEISTNLKWCSGGGEIGYHVKNGGHHFAEREFLTTARYWKSATEPC